LHIVFYLAGFGVFSINPLVPCAQASTPTLASRKDLQSPAPLRAKDAASAARDERQALASLNGLSMRDPSPASGATASGVCLPVRAGTPTAAELAERRRRAMDVAGFVSASVWNGKRR
jgi:hypothetical protein